MGAEDYFTIVLDLETAHIVEVCCETDKLCELGVRDSTGNLVEELIGYFDLSHFGSASLEPQGSNFDFLHLSSRLRLQR